MTQKELENTIRIEIASVHECVGNADPCSIEDHTSVILDLINQHVAEVIGENNHPDDFVGTDALNVVIDRNELRAEQRERAGI